jgi:hypothetical protein
MNDHNSDAFIIHDEDTKFFRLLRRKDETMR